MSNLIDRMFNGSGGMQAARMMEALGMPSTVAEMAGAQIDLAKGDMAGVQRLMMAATQGLSTAQADNLFGKGLAPMGFVPRPSLFGGALGSLVGGAVAGLPGALLGGAAGALANPLFGRGFNPFGGGITREAPFGTGREGRSIERAIQQNPLFKGMLERQLGGTILPDMRNDGRLTIYRPPFNQLGGVMREAMAGGLLPQVGLANVFARAALPLGGALAGNMVAGSILGSMTRLEGNMASFMGRMTGDHVGQARGELMMDRNTSAMAQGMGIDIRNASFEDILFLMLMKYAKKKEDDIMAKVKQLDQSSKAAADKGGSQGKGGLGGILGAAGGIVGNMIAPGVGGAIGGALGQGVGGAIGGAGNTSSTAGAGLAGTDLGGTMDPSSMSETMKQQAMQKLMGDLSKLYEMLSNMIKSMHDMQMTPTRNLRSTRKALLRLI